MLRDAIAHDLKLYELRLALTDETPALSQTTDELNSLINTEASSLLHSFLSGNVDNNELHHIDEDVLISVVPMDDSQRRAVCSALNKKVSVVTGPPGTGKTQMIINLIANALLFGKRVLVASKNNKAVDNVKERFDSCLLYTSRTWPLHQFDQPRLRDYTSHRRHQSPVEVSCSPAPYPSIASYYSLDTPPSSVHRDAQ